jgi:hypothetical protein
MTHDVGNLSSHVKFAYAVPGGQTSRVVGIFYVGIRSETARPKDQTKVNQPTHYEHLASELDVLSQ